MAIKKKLSFEARIALIAVFTSIGALCISAYQAYMQRLQTYASAMPSLNLYTSSNYNSESSKGNSFELILENKGVGPAKIDSVNYEFNGNAYPYFMQIVNKTTNSSQFGTNELFKNRLISSNEKISIVTVYDSSAKLLNEKFLKSEKPEKIVVKIIYSSIFGEKWKINWSNIEQEQSNVKLD